jgi:hypothetical protein
VKPRAAIRRFDVFAEYNRLEALRDGRPEDEAKGHGLWVAKVVASRRGRPSLAPTAPRPSDGNPPSAPAADHEKFKSLSGEVQTDKLFDREVVERMGREFYRDVFAPAIGQAFEEGRPYQSIRDAIRREWKP